MQTFLINGVRIVHHRHFVRNLNLVFLMTLDILSISATYTRVDNGSSTYEPITRGNVIEVGSNIFQEHVWRVLFPEASHSKYSSSASDSQMDSRGSVVPLIFHQYYTIEPLYAESSIYNDVLVAGRVVPCWLVSSSSPKVCAFGRRITLCIRHMMS